MTIRNYTDLVAWQRAMTTAEAVYRLTKSLPTEEMYGLRSQMRRAAISMPSNIAEGQGRRTDGEFLHLLSIAHGSVRELETQTILAERLGLIAKDDTHALGRDLAEVGRLITGLMNSIERHQE